MFAIKVKVNGELYNQSSSMAFDETSSYWSALKAPNFLVFHWSPHDSPVSTGQHVVTTRVVHFLKRLKQAQSLSLRGPNHQFERVCGLCIAAVAGFVYFELVISLLQTYAF